MMSVILATSGLALGVLGVVGWVVATADSAPNINDLKPRDPGQISQVFAADGTSLGYIQSDTLRTAVPGNKLPNALKNATVAIEDRRFYKHRGVDYQGVLRAGIRDVFGGGKTIQGGSTLTMQLVRNIYLPTRLADTRTLKRKIIEAKLAEELEKKHSKSWILASYVNDVDYGTTGGQTAIGVGAAAEMFFNKPVSKLDLAQSAMLAGLPQAPSSYNPFLRPGIARSRRHDVLQAMVQSHYITRAQANAADAEPLGVQHNTTFGVRKEQYFFDYVQQSLHQKFCPGKATCPKVDQGGLKIYTTIDLTKQQEARDAITANEGNPGDPAAGVVTIDQSNGHIQAMASSGQYAQTNFNYAAQAHRQTGSSMKLFVLMTLIHDYQGDPSQTYYNSHELLPGWLAGYPTYHVQTAEHSYLGNVDLVKATALSDNTVFAQLDADVGPDKVRDTAYAMGITSHLDGFPAEGIGGLRTGVSPLEMADAYATVANGGTHYPPTAVSKVVFPDGSSVDLGDSQGHRVFTDGEAATATNVLKQVVSNGTGTAAQIGCPQAGKTGTTSNYTDAWFIGYTPKLTTSVWVGYPNSTTSMNDVNGLGPGFGGTLAAPIWHDYMAKAIGSYCTDFPSPKHPFHGTAFFGGNASTGSSGVGTSGNNGTGSGSGGTGTGSGAVGGGPGQYTNPNLYAVPPQSPTGGGGRPGTGGGLRGAPPGFGNGHRGSGGTGIKHP
jgi:penicillin-binding protein 1A